jgi:integrase
MRHAFNLAIREWEWLKDNPVARVSKDKVDNARDRWLTIEEDARLLEASVLHATGERNVKIPRYWAKDIILFALNTGKRQDEILSLRWPDVDLFRKTVAITRSKNGEKRTVPMNERVFGLLKEKARVRDIRSDFIFVSEAGTKIHARNLRRAFYLALERSGIEDFRFHDLRHTFASHLVMSGVDITTVSHLLGHRSLTMTLRYAHLSPGHLVKAVATLDTGHTLVTLHVQVGAALRQTP